MLSSSTPTPTAATTGTAGDQNSSNSTLKLHNRLSSSSSSSSSFSTFSSKPAPAPPPATTASNSGSSAAWTKTMEEVWKDINLASLNDQNTRPITTTNTFGSGIMFQDFLARPFTINDPTNSNNNTTPSPSYSSSSASPTPHRLTALSLGSRPDFHFDHHHHPSLRPNGVHVQHNYNHNHNHPVNTSKACFSANPSSPFDPLPCSSSLPCFGSKRFAEPADATPGDRRNKRMIKNRESAARSRARKQEKLAYTNELQLKVDHLLEENARLKRQQQQLCEAAASQQKKKNSLHRTSTAPF